MLSIYVIHKTVANINIYICRSINCRKNDDQKPKKKQQTNEKNKKKLYKKKVRINKNDKNKETRDT